jgi:endonuclease/exonuclease/phosphatase family metal-dependent hydrolase
VDSLFAILLLSFLFAGWAASALATDEIVVASYNLENYLGEEQAAPPTRKARPKSEKSIATEIRIIKEIGPDIIGVCEMGRPEQFADFKRRLDEAGLGYVDSEYVEAADPDRHLALFSRFPIVAHQSQPDVTYELNGAPRKVARGFLDVTVRVNDHYDLRLVGVHLKSKLPIPEGDAIVRRHEAELVRHYIEKIMTTDPEVNLLLYGDFNDTKNEAPIIEIAGPRGSPMHMMELLAKDSVGDRWTHYWQVADLYSRIDYLFASPALLHEIVSGKASVYRSDDWFEASDHRAIYTSIVPTNRRH